MSKTHSILGASSAHRWFHCPGSPRLCDGVPNSSSEYSHEGSAAHHLCERLLKEEIFGADWAKDRLGWFIELVGKDAYVVKEYMSGKAPENAFEVTQEMAEAVDLYLATVRHDRDNALEGQLLVENRFKLDHLHDGLWGTNDACLLDAFDGLLRVYDFKYGVGVPVEVQEGGKPNPQLAYYALGALPISENIETVELVVVQPRAKHSEGPVRRFTMSRADLEAWAQEVLLPAVARTERPDAPLVAGEWCKSSFCRARTVCPEHRKMACEIGGAEFDEDLMPVAIPTLPPAEAIPPGKLGRMLDYINLLEPWFKDIRAHAKDLRQRGVDIGGWKIVETRATRKWISPTEAERKLFPVLKEDLLVSEIKSVPQAEKALKAAGLSKDTIKALMEGLVEESRGTTLAPAYDKREEVQSAAVAFADDDPLADDPFAE